MPGHIVNNTPVSIRLSVDESGFTNYKVTFLVVVDNPYLESVYTVWNTPGLPLPGSPYTYGISEIDVVAWCRHGMEITPVGEKEVIQFYMVACTFSSKPPDQGDYFYIPGRQVLDPILLPPKVNGHFVRYNEEATADRFERAIHNSSMEQVRGPQVTFDKNRPQIKIEMNMPAGVFSIAKLGALVDTVNAYPLWGYSPRTIKLSDISWDRRYSGYGFLYFHLNLVFDIDPTTWDRDLLDEGTMVLKGAWDQATGTYVTQNIAGNPPDPNNPTHFVRYRDRYNTLAKVILNGSGLPAARLVTGKQYVAAAPVPGDPTIDLSDIEFWAEMTGIILPFYAELAYYLQGDIVEFVDGNSYLAIRDGQLGAPTVDVTGWYLLAPTPLPAAVNWVPGAVYAQGAVVNSTAVFKAGTIPVSYYHESDFVSEFGLLFPTDINSFF